MSFSGRLRRLLGRTRPMAPEPPPENDPVPPTVRELNRLLAAGQLGWPPGHFYSTIPDLTEVWQREAAIFPPPSAELPGIQLRIDQQLQLLAKLGKLQAGVTFPAQKQPGVRYYHDNPNFMLGEAVVLYSMMRFLEPKRIIEIGSGFSSCLILDINESLFQGSITCSFIEPNPELLLQLIESGDQFTLRQQPVQDVDLELFSQLAGGDILLVDTSHVSRIGSDVNHIVFEILPRLQEGVWVHFHDVMYNFDYPKDWVYQGRIWNEAYLLRAFLQYNHAFSIEFFSSYLGEFHREALVNALPLCDSNAGTSLWLRRNR